MIDVAGMVPGVSSRSGRRYFRGRDARLHVVDDRKPRQQWPARDPDVRSAARRARPIARRASTNRPARPPIWESLMTDAIYINRQDVEIDVGAIAESTQPELVGTLRFFVTYVDEESGRLCVWDGVLHADALAAAREPSVRQAPQFHDSIVGPWRHRLTSNEICANIR